MNEIGLLAKIKQQMERFSPAEKKDSRLHSRPCRTRAEYDDEGFGPGG
ncbi:hypothetical protein [Geobacillus sp. WSUCF1]|nr:hypothetical protein [Geobacillus sp. WSUCF1]EPR29495.1 Transcriptional regulator, RpiR family protein [Geobacillus sp. WSUCF1]